MKSLLFHRIVFLIFISFASMACYASKEALKPELQTLLNTVVSENGTPGAVLLITSPKINSVAVASGYSDIKTKTPMTADNNFRIASMSKTFLAVAILKLVEEGKIDLDAKMADYLPDSIEVDRIPNGKEATVRELLEMRSGIPNYMEFDAYSTMVADYPDHVWTPKDCIKIIYDAEATFKPGSAYEYSNSNYIILQQILETITGESYSNAFKKYIFEPAGMKNTYVEFHEEREGGYKGLHTHGYEERDKKIIDITEYNDGFGLGDGGIVSTAHDMMLFVRSLFETKILLPENLLTEMLQIKGKDKYGLGIYQEEAGDELAWTHNGSASGFSGQFYYLPKEKIIIIVLTNMTGSGIYDAVVSGALPLLQNE